MIDAPMSKTSEEKETKTTIMIKTSRAK